MWGVVSPEIADSDEANTVEVEKQRAHRALLDGELNDLSACVLLSLTSSWRRHCSPRPIVEDCSAH